MTKKDKREAGSPPRASESWTIAMAKKHRRDTDMSPEAIERRIKEVFEMTEACSKLAKAELLGPVERPEVARRADAICRARTEEKRHPV